MSAVAEVRQEAAGDAGGMHPDTFIFIALESYAVVSVLAILLVLRRLAPAGPAE